MKKGFLGILALTLILGSCVSFDKVDYVFDESIPADERAILWIYPAGGDALRVTKFSDRTINWHVFGSIKGYKVHIPSGQHIIIFDYNYAGGDLWQRQQFNNLTVTADFEAGKIYCLQADFTSIGKIRFGVCSAEKIDGKYIATWQYAQ